MTTSKNIQWHVLVRQSTAHIWVPKGFFGTRDAARRFCTKWRKQDRMTFGWTLGDTRVERLVNGEK